MNAMDEYKRTSGRMFPTCSEVLEVIRELGYARLSPTELTLHSPADTETLPAADAENAIDAGALESEELVTNGWTV